MIARFGYCTNVLLESCLVEIGSTECRDDADARKKDNVYIATNTTERSRLHEIWHFATLSSFPSLFPFDNVNSLTRCLFFIGRRKPFTYFEQ
jgi:hypothetical protein